MEEQTIQPVEESKPQDLTPEEKQRILKQQRHQRLTFYQEQTKFLKEQAAYQRLVTEIAKLESEELKAELETMSYKIKINQLMNPKDGAMHTLTQEDLDKYPELTEKYKVGDVIDLSKPLEKK